jgi:hypothetical protein
MDFVALSHPLGPSSYLLLGLADLLTQTYASIRLASVGGLVGFRRASFRFGTVRVRERSSLMEAAPAILGGLVCEGAFGNPHH